MRILPLLAISSMAALGCNNLLANDISYTYAEIGYTAYEDDSTVNLGGSFALNEAINVIGNVETGEVDLGISNVTANLTVSEIGVGAHTAIAPTTDAFATVSYANLNLDASGSIGSGATINFSDSTGGYSLGAGIRHKFTDQVEGHLKIKHTEFSDADISRTIFTGGGRFDFTPNIGIGLDLSTDDDETFATSSLRYSTL